MDSVSIHHSGWIVEMCEKRGVWFNALRLRLMQGSHHLAGLVGVLLVHLPPYCPELNPIELGFEVMEINLRRLQVLVIPNCEPKYELEKATYKAFTRSLLAKVYG